MASPTPAKLAAKSKGRVAPAAHGVSKLSYPGTLGMLALALAFPIALMVFNPTLMFERGWEQYVGTSIYAWAVLTLGRELVRLWRNEGAFAEAKGWLDPTRATVVRAGAIADDDRRILPARVRQLAAYAAEAREPSASQLMEVHREGSGLDQEHAAGRFTLPKYILYLLPVIGFIGTVEGISKALMNISRVLPMVKDLDAFLNNLTSVTSALQIAFDSTLLALFLSSALMLVQTLVYRRAEDLLARVDRWVVDHALPPARPRADAAGPRRPVGAGSAPEMADALRGPGRRDRGPTTVPCWLDADGRRLGPHVDRFAGSVDRLPPGLLAGLLHRAPRRSTRRARTSNPGLGEAGRLAAQGRRDAGEDRGRQRRADGGQDEQLERDQAKGIDRQCVAVEALAGQWSAGLRALQPRHARSSSPSTLNSLKDALDMLNVSMEQGNALYRSIVKRTFSTYPVVSQDTEAA